MTIVYEYGGHGVDIRLQSTMVPPGVYWAYDQNFSSTVAVADPEGKLVTKDGRRVQLISINGIGETRWHVDESTARESWPKLLEFFELREVGPRVKNYESVEQWVEAVRIGDVGGDPLFPFDIIYRLLNTMSPSRAEEVLSDILVRNGYWKEVE